MDYSEADTDDGVREIHLVYEIRCADSRDRGITEGTVGDYLHRLYIRAGIEVVRTSLIGAGVFATADLIYALKRGIHRDLAIKDSERENICEMRGEKGGIPLRVIVQVNTHADVSLAEGVEDGKVVYSKGELRIVPESGINCGMGHAFDVYQELMNFIIERRLQVRIGSELVTVNDDDGLLKVLKEKYGFEGENPEEFIRPIHDHTRHVAKQAAKISNALGDDFQLRDVNAVVNAGITNYRTGRVFRVDRNADVYTILDDIAALTALILAQLPDGHPEKSRRVEKQQPQALLLCTPNVEHPRNMLVGYLNAVIGSVWTPGSVFAVSGHDVAGATYPFGPYRLLSIFYALKHLGIRDLYLLGTDEGEVRRMEKKIRRDPIVADMIGAFGVNVHRLTRTEATDRSRDSVPPIDRALQDAIREGRRVFANNLPPKSPLNRIPPEKLKRLQTA